MQALSELPTEVHFSQYRAVLKNKTVVDEIEKRFKAFKPSSYDLARQLKAIDAFEVEAVKNAEATLEKVELEIKDLEKTLKNISEARPFDQLTLVRQKILFISFEYGFEAANSDLFFLVFAGRYCKSGAIDRRKDKPTCFERPVDGTWL